MEKFLSHLINERNLSPETVRAYRNDIEQLCKWADAKVPLELADLEVQQVRQFLAHLNEKGYSKTTIKRHMAPLVDKGYVREIEGGQGKSYLYKATAKDPLEVAREAIRLLPEGQTTEDDLDASPNFAIDAIPPQTAPETAIRGRIEDFDTSPQDRGG